MVSIIYIRVVQLLHSCGPLFKIIRVCGPQSAKNSYFRSKIRVFSKKKKKGLHLESVCKIPIFVPKSGCSLKKKKKKVFTWNRSANFPFSFQNQVFSKKKKKKKVFTWNRSPKFLFWRKIIAFSKKKITAAASDRQDLCKIDMRHAAREPVVGPRCYRRLPLLMIDKT